MTKSNKLSRADVVSTKSARCHKHVWNEVDARASLVFVFRTHVCLECGKVKKTKDFFGA